MHSLMNFKLQGMLISLNNGLID